MSAFLDQSGGQWRYRIVKPGFDARNLSLPANTVIFDTQSSEYLTVYVSGSLSISSGDGGQYKAVTWPSLGYVPYGWAAFKKDGRFIIPVLSSPTESYSQGAVSIVADGLIVETRGLNYPVVLDYLVFRVGVP